MPFMNSVSTFLGRGLKVRSRGSSGMGSRTLVTTSRTSTVFELDCSSTVRACDNLFFFTGRRGSLFTTALGRLRWFGHNPHPTPPQRNAYVGPLNPSNKSIFTSSSPITENSRLNHVVKLKVAALFKSPFTFSGVLLKKHFTVVQRAVP